MSKLIFKPLAIATVTLLYCATFAAAQGKHSSDAGIEVSKQATAKEVGLPLYPGAKPHKEDSNETPSTKLGLWGGGFGFKLVVLKLESKDPADKIAAFYQKALAKYGKVLNCTSSDSHPETQDKKESNKITCDEDKPDAGGMLYKSGTQDKQHIVEIKPATNGLTVFTLLRMETQGTEDKEAL
jgi:hypothetical protein